MKHVLITGANSYVGTHVAAWLMKTPDQFQVDTVDTMNDTWKHADFSKYDVVFHVAAIVHIKEKKQNFELYKMVNTVLPLQIAKKAKMQGVKQFVFMSSMSVYGLNAGIITKETIPNPRSYYGITKLDAEKKLKLLVDSSFTVTILRPPMIYGAGCKGNFQKLITISRFLPIFPKITNKRSMIYIDNFCEFVRIVIDVKSDGVFFPQNKRYITTTQMLIWCSQKIGRSVFTSSLLGAIIKTLLPLSSTLQKAFGSLIYQDTEDFSYSYDLVEEEFSVKKSI